jgi:cation diffusion facilitator family transporter
MAGSAVVNLIVSHLLFRVGKKTDSIALQADGWHLRTDVYTSLGVMLGLAIIWAGDKTYEWTGMVIFKDLHWVDPVAAMVVAGLIIRAAWKLTRESAADLLDATLPPEEEARIREVPREFVPRVRGFHRMRTRKAGPQRFVEFHIFVDGRMTVRESHDLTHDIAARIRKSFLDASVVIHVEPCPEPCPGGCTASCLLTDDQRRQVGENRAPA